MMVPDRRIQLVGKEPPNSDQTPIWEMSEEIEYVPAMRIDELARHTDSGFRSKYG